jgi:hypothetical protein
MKFDWGVAVRVACLLLLLTAAIGLIVNKHLEKQQPQQTPQSIDWKNDLPKIDAGIDTVFAHFGIPENPKRKRAIPIPDAPVSRIERRIDLPAGVMPVELNQALNNLAQQFGARAIASENLHDHIVTIHIVVNNYIIQTVIASTKLDQSGKIVTKTSFKRSGKKAPTHGKKKY